MGRHALLIGVPGRGLDVRLAIERLAAALGRIGFAIETCVGEQATRRGLLDRLAGLIDRCEPGDAHVIYYFGHGGRVRFTDIDEGRELFGFVSCHAERGFEAVLDRELSAALTLLDARCGNVTAIFDCCYSGELVRADAPALDVGELAAPQWARELLARPADVKLAIDSHPRIVRLGGASPKRQAFALVRGGSNIGALTEALLDTLEAAGEQWSSVTWAAAIHAIRERVFERLRFEGQWPALVGPRNRLLFSTEHAAMPGTVSLVPSKDPRVAYLRAGWHQGVAVGDRWVACALDVDAEGRPRPLAEGVIEAVERSRSTWVLERGELGSASGLPAYPAREPASDGRDRVAALRRTLAERAPDPCPVRWTWARSDGAELPAAGAVLDVGDRVQITLECSSDAPPCSWFVSAVFIDPDGRPRLLSTRMPEGIELRPGERERIGVRSGRREHGLALTWPRAESTDVGAASLLFLASRRPIALAHVVPEQPLDEFEALVVQGLAEPRTRAAKPEAAAGCAWGFIDFELRGRPS